jgi:8-oxo-dGTP pyrophosphatase MutT (NUDIX family)
MRREFSAGGVLVRRLRGRWVFAAINPRGRPAGIWALPKGVIDAGERAEQTALREIEEETGAHGHALAKLGDIRYVFTQSWGPPGERGQRVFKVVSFFLVRYGGGRLGTISEEMQREVVSARWFPLDDAEDVLAYKGEREMAAKARAMISDQCPPTP